MTLLILRRLVSGVALVLVVTAITFFLTSAADVPVARNILGLGATDEQIAAKTAQLGLDRPVVVQYLDWLASAARGDLGRSYYSNEPVVSALSSRLPITLSMVLLACAFTLVLGVTLGVVAAVRGGWVDRVLQGVSIVAHVFPGIVLAVYLVLVFSITLRLLPATGFVPFSESPGAWFRSMLLPAVTLAIGGVAALAAQIRGALIDELSKDYVRTLRSRGFSPLVITGRHALRNAASPGLTTFSLQFIAMFGGALFIERIFAMSGFGSYAFSSTIQGDLPATMGVTLISVLLVVVVNLLVDLTNGWLNPKARIS